MKRFLSLFLIPSVLCILNFFSCGQKRTGEDFLIFVNYELGMHCTGFDFEYCCVLPPYNSIQAQVVKTGKGVKKPRLMEKYDPSDPTVLIDRDTGKRYRLKYEIVDNSFSEGGKMNYWNVRYDMNRNGDNSEPGENVANAYFSHLYIYQDLEGSNPSGTSRDQEKMYIGGPKLQIPRDHGPSGQAMQGYLRNATAKGTIVFTKSPALDNVPIVLTNPGVWEALGLPLTPFLDSEVGKQNYLKLLEKNIQPYQVAKVTLVDAETDQPVINSDGKVASFVGTNPIDIPNCNNCHANKNANAAYPEAFELMNKEKEYWLSIGASEWIASLKATSISILKIHDLKHGTRFTARYNPSASSNRLGRNPVLCQKCHGDNVIGVLGAGKVVLQGGKLLVMDMARTDLALPDDVPVEELDASNPNAPKPGTVILPLTEAIHLAHQEMRPLPDGQGRSGTCQGCHPAHRYDRNLAGYPITPDGRNAYDGSPGSFGSDNRDATGGCFVNRDVHSNPKKDMDGAETPEHLNAIGRWIKQNVSRTSDGKMIGLWCTNCHNRVSKELYKLDRLAPGKAFQPGPGETVRTRSLEDIAAALGMAVEMLTEYLDPKVKLDENGHDRGVIRENWARREDGRTSAGIAVIKAINGKPVIKLDEDNDPSVEILSPNPDFLTKYRPKEALVVSYDDATMGRDYWLSPGEPHCADCHLPPFVEGQGGVAYPINQPGKYSLMRYSKGHSGFSCQACHQSPHGMYPVTPHVDETTYRQAASLNRDGSHGPIKCLTCHDEVNSRGIPYIAKTILYKGKPISDDYDLAVEWMHASARDQGGAMATWHSEE